MMASEKFSQLESKIDQVIGRLQELTLQNASLKDENERLKRELGQIKREFKSLKVVHADQADAVRTRLSSVLDRVSELEALSH
jgi:FtsZ-binding cell division protein ZapB